MVVSGAEGKKARKNEYFKKLVKLLDEYPRIFIVGADNVGSAQMAKIRHALRGKAVILMGKNTMIRKVIRGGLDSHPELESLLPHVKSNIGFVFVQDNLSVVKKILEENKVSAPAKAGATSPLTVIIPSGATGMEPTQTSFFQALNIPTKINKGQIEIVNEVTILRPGDKVGASEANLLSKLNIRPFSYGLRVRTVYDVGAIYDPSLLDLTEADVINRFNSAVKNIACIGLAIGYPTIASLPHSIARGYKNALSISLATDYSTPQAEKLKAILANPGAAAPAAKAAHDNKPAAKAAVVKEEPKEEEDDDMGFGLFD